MTKGQKILVINPGSTSTKIAVFENDCKLVENTIRHDSQTLSGFHKITDQLQVRKAAVLDFLSDAGIQIDTLGCIVARGGLLKPIPGGTYIIDDAMCRELATTPREHASNLAALIASEIAEDAGIQAFIVDPIVVDEMCQLAKISGLKEMERNSIFHALNQKAIARRTAGQFGKRYEECNFIVAHMGGGISIGAHKKGKVIDVNNALDGDGPFSPERTGSLPVAGVIDLCFNSGLTEEEIKRKTVGKGGLVSYLGTNDAQAVEKMIIQGDQQAMLVFEAMAYQVSKEIGSCAAVLSGCVDAVILTGGLAYSERLVQWIRERVMFIAPVVVYPGEWELEALAAAGLRIMKGEEEYKKY